MDHDLRLNGYFIGLQFVMDSPWPLIFRGRAGQCGGFRGFLGPWNLQKEIETVDNVRFYLDALVGVETPFRD